MFIQYHSLDISFRLDRTHFRVLNIAQERLERIIPSHSHGENSYEIHYNASGRGQLLTDGRLYRLEPDSLYLVGPHISHAQIPDQDAPQLDYCIYLQLSHSEKGDSHGNPLSTLFENRTFWIGKNSQSCLPSLFSRLFDELSDRQPGYTVWVETLLRQLIVAMIRNYGDAPACERFQPATPEEAQAFTIEEAFLYEYPVLTLERLAARLQLSPRQTQRLLRMQYGKTFQQKRSEARMSAAEILLTHTHRPIHAIADALGYASPEHFACTFRQRHGVPATEYRRLHAIHSDPLHDAVLDPPEGLRSANVPGRQP